MITNASFRFQGPLAIVSRPVLPIAASTTAPETMPPPDEHINPPLHMLCRTDKTQAHIYLLQVQEQIL